MKRHRHYTDSSIDFHAEVVDSKHHHPSDADYKTRIAALRPIAERRFPEYDDKFATDRLEDLIEQTYTPQEKKDLLSLYDYDTKPFARLKIDLSVDETGRKQPYCPLCDLGEHSSFDHILPKSKFPDYADHPINLIRSCWLCNGKKSSNWKENGRRKYINFYFDDIPHEQILFATVWIEDNTIAQSFTVDNRNGIDVDLFRKMANHIGDLELCDRYGEYACDVISSLEDDIEGCIEDGLTLDEIREAIMRKSRREQERFGVNYWRAVLKMACVGNDEVLRFLVEGKYE